MPGHQARHSTRGGSRDSLQGLAGMAGRHPGSVPIGSAMHGPVPAGRLGFSRLLAFKLFFLAGSFPGSA